MILSSTPINKQTAIVISKTKDENPFFSSGATAMSMIPFPTKEWTGNKYHDLTGRKCGSFIVIGCALYEKNVTVKIKTTKSTTRWVARCKCGYYQMLTNKSIKKNSPDTMCQSCHKKKSLAKTSINGNLFN